MATWVALLRGINVGGRNRLPMADLRRMFTDAGCENVSTYIQSGNVVFAAAALSTDEFVDKMASAIDRDYGFRPGIHLLPAADLEDAIAGNPFRDAEDDPRSLHVSFLDQVPDENNVQRANELLAKSESCQLVGRHLYLHAPDGIARSRFAARVEKTLGVGVTARNWRSVTRIAAIAARMTPQSQ